MLRGLAANADQIYWARMQRSPTHYRDSRGGDDTGLTSAAVPHTQGEDRDGQPGGARINRPPDPPSTPRPAKPAKKRPRGKRAGPEPGNFRN